MNVVGMTTHLISAVLAWPLTEVVPGTELDLHGQATSTVAACCLQLMQRVPGGLLSAAMCSRLQACLASRGKGLHTDTLKIHLGTVTSPAIHGVLLQGPGIVARHASTCRGFLAGAHICRHPHVNVHKTLA